jgi:O-antigen/teichoic acid export membrane protein
VTSQTLSLSVLRETFRTRIAARKFLRNVGALTVANFVGAALNFAQGIFVARWLGPELYGLAALVMTYPSVVHAFFDARSSDASVKYLGEYHGQGERDRALAMCKLGYAVDLAIACVAFLVLVFTAGFAAQSLVRDPTIAGLMVFYAAAVVPRAFVGTSNTILDILGRFPLAVACLTFLVLVFTARLAAESIAHDPAVAGLMILYGAALIPRALVGTSNAILKTLGRFSFIAWIEILTTVVRTVLMVGLVLAGWQVAGVVWANAAAATVASLLYGALAWVLIRRTWGGSIFQGDIRVLKGGRRQIFAFLAYNDLNALVGMIPKQLDVILLGYFRGPTEVGYYRLAKSISSVTEYLTGPLRSVTYAELARLWGLGHREAFSQKVRKLATRIGLPLGVFALLGGGLMSVALPLLVGEIYIPAVQATQLLLVGSAILLGFFWLGPVYLAKGHVRQRFVIGSSVTVGFALIYPFVIREWGYMGASGWMLALHVVGNAVAGFWLWTQPEEEEKHGGAIEKNNQKPTIQKTDERRFKPVQEQS